MKEDQTDQASTQPNLKNSMIICVVLFLTLVGLAAALGILIAKATTRVAAQLPRGSIIALWTIIAPFTLTMIFAWWWQFQVFRGKEMKSSDGSMDSWHVEKLYYGIPVADITLGIPVSLLGTILIALGLQSGFVIWAMIAFWVVWINLATTLTSLRFEDVRFTASWIMEFPFFILLGLAYLVWFVVNYDAVF